MADMQQQNIVIDGIRAIRHLDIPIQPGVVVLRGANGCGKTTAIDAVRQLVGSENKTAEPSDGLRRGSIALGDAKLIVSGTSVRKGLLEVKAIEDRVDIGKFVNPGIKDPERADAARLKILVRLTGVEADMAPYHELVRGVIEPDGLMVAYSDDPVVLAARVKDAIEALARTEEACAADRKSRADQLAALTCDVDLTDPSDEQQLRDAREQAAVEYEATKQRQNECIEQQHRAARAEEQLAAMSEDEDEIIKQTRLAVKGCVSAAIKLKNRLEENEIEKILLEQELKTVGENEVAHNRKLAECQQIKDQRAELKKAIESVVEVVTDAQIKSAAQRLEIARKAEENGRIIRDAIEKARQHEKDTQAHKEFAARAEKLRELAAKVEGVLTDQLPTGDLRVANGRIVLDTDREYPELFADLSRGERTRIAVALAARTFPGSGLLMLDQESWEGLDPENQESVIKQAEQLGICILTAQVDSGELRVEARP